MAHSPRFRLRIERGKGPRSELLSGEERVVIGRSAKADLVVEDDSVSLIHCEVCAEEEQLVLRDLGSCGGTWIGGIRVREVVLNGETLISMGTAEVSFQVVGGREEASPSVYPESHFGRLVGESKAMRRTFARLANAAA